MALSACATAFKIILIYVFLPLNLPILSFFSLSFLLIFGLFCLLLVFTSKISYVTVLKELSTRVYFIGARSIYMRFKLIRYNLILKTINLLNEIFYI